MFSISVNDVQFWQLNAPFFALLLLLSICSVSLIVEKLLLLIRWRWRSRHLLDKISLLLKDGELEQLALLMAREHGPEAILLRTSFYFVQYETFYISLEEKMAGKKSIFNLAKTPTTEQIPHLEIALKRCIEELSLQLEKHCNLFHLIANVATLLGLLGTVTGMIYSFQNGALEQSSQLAQGIAQALVTTAGGLIVAIPSIIGQQLFLNSGALRVAGLEQLSQDILFFMHQRSLSDSRFDLGIYSSSKWQETKVVPPQKKEWQEERVPEPSPSQLTPSVAETGVCGVGIKEPIAIQEHWQPVEQSGKPNEIRGKIHGEAHQIIKQELTEDIVFSKVTTDKMEHPAYSDSEEYSVMPKQKDIPKSEYSEAHKIDEIQELREPILESVLESDQGAIVVPSQSKIKPKHSPYVEAEAHNKNLLDFPDKLPQNTSHSAAPHQMAASTLPNSDDLNFADRLAELQFERQKARKMQLERNHNLSSLRANNKRPRQISISRSSIAATARSAIETKSTISSEESSRTPQNIKNQEEDTPGNENANDHSSDLMTRIKMPRRIDEGPYLLHELEEPDMTRSEMKKASKAKKTDI